MWTKGRGGRRRARYPQLTIWGPFLVAKAAYFEIELVLIALVLFRAEERVIE